MKIGVYSPNLSPETGGGHTYEQDLVQAILDVGPATKHTFAFIGRDVPVSCGRLRRKFLKMTSTLHHAILRVPDLWDRFLVRRLVKHGIECLWYLTPCALTLDIPYLATVFDLQHRLQPFFPEVSARGVWEAREAFYRPYLQRAAGVIVPNEAGRGEVERFYGVAAERIRILPHPTPTFALNAPPEAGRGVLEKYGLKAGYLFYPAQFWPHKNHATILHALRLLGDVQAVFVGSDKRNREHVIGLARELGVSNLVHFLGFVSREDLIPLYRNALAITYMTYFGPENLPPLEAFALGCPVIASDVSGASEQLGDAALLVPPSDPRELAAAVAAIQRDSTQRQGLIEKGKTRARRFTTADYVAGALRFFNEFETVRRCWGKAAWS